MSLTHFNGFRLKLVAQEKIKVVVKKSINQVFDEMPERKVVSWTAMMSAHSKRGYAPEALDLLVKLLRSGIEPKSGLAAYEMGKQIHSHTLRSGVSFYVVL